MEEAERTKERNASCTINACTQKLSNTVNNQGSVQLAGQQQKVSSNTCSSTSHLTVVLALATPCVSHTKTRVSGPHCGKVAKYPSAHDCKLSVDRRKARRDGNCSFGGGVARVVSPYFGGKDGCFVGGKEGKGGGDGEKNVGLDGRRRKSGVGEVSGVELSGVVEKRGNERGCCGVEEGEEHVGGRDSLRGMVMSKHEEKCEVIEEEDDDNKNNVALKGKRGKQRGENAGAGEVSGVKLREVEKRGNEGDLPSAVVEQEDKCEAFEEEGKDVDDKRKYVGLKGKRSKRMREIMGAGEVIGVESREGEKRKTEGICYGMEENEEHVMERNLLVGVAVVKDEDKHEDLDGEKDVADKRKIVALKGKRGNRRRDKVDTCEVLAVESSETAKRENEGHCYGPEQGDKHFEERNLQSAVAAVKHEEKREDLEDENKRQKRIRAGVMSDGDVRVVSPYFVKVDNCHGEIMDGSNQKMKKKKRKKKVENDQGSSKVEMDAPNSVLPKVVSSYFQTKGANDHENSKSEFMEEAAEWKTKKPRSSKKRKTCSEDKEMETKKILKERKIKKRTAHNESCTEEKDGNTTLGLGYQGASSSDLVIKVKKEVKSERCLKEVIAKTATSGFQDKINQRVRLAEIDVKGGSRLGDMENNCMTRVEPQKTTSPCSKNVRRKRIKPMKIENKDDQNSGGGEEGRNMKLSCTNKKSKKKSKKKSSCSNCLTDGGQEDVLESSPAGYRKEDCVHDKQGCVQASPAKKASPYFQKPLENKECKDERDESYHKNRHKRKIDKAALKEFDELLSRYTYKTDNMMNLDNNGGVDEVNGSAVKQEGKKKQRRGLTNRPLTREEKFVEAYKRKAPNNAWKPPSSPFELLQEDHAHDPWRVLVICMLLNITTGPQVRNILSLFFQLCPNAEAAVATNVNEIAQKIQSLGLQRKRAAMIQRFSSEYLSGGWTHVTELHGIGKYAADAYAIFCNGMWDQVTPNDHKLNYYWKFLQNRALRARQVWNI